MMGRLFDRTARLLGEVILQTVPPGLLTAIAASELARLTTASFAQSAGIVCAVLLICLMVNGLRE